MQYKLASVLAVGALVAVGNGAPIAQEPGLSTPSVPTIGRPSSDTTWSKRDVVWDPTTPATGDGFNIGKPSTGIIWSKRGGEDSKPKDTFTVGNPTTVVDWDKRAEPVDEKEIGDASTVVTWS